MLDLAGPGVEAAPANLVLLIDRMSVTNVKVLNHRNASIAKIENDGLDLVSVRDGHVSRNFVMTCDDAMCAKARSTPVRNVTFADNVVWSSCGGNKAGMQANA
jgi:polygalacturonase